MKTAIKSLLLNGSKFNPLALSPFLWVDAVKGAYNSTLDNNGTRKPGNLIDTSNEMTGKSLVIGAELTKPVYNGVGWFFRTGAEITQGVAADYNFIHNGSDFDIFFTYFQPPCATGATRALLTNNGFSATARGILLQYDNGSNLNALKLRIGNGTVSVIRIDCNNAITQNSISRIRVTKTGNKVTIFVNGIQVGTQTNTGWSALDAAAAMKIFSASSATARVYLLDLLILNRNVTAGELISINARSFSVPACRDVNTYLWAGDSNSAGRGLNASIAADLTAAIDNSLVSQFSAGGITRSEKLQVNRNQTYYTEQPLTYHGSEMRFMKSMCAVKEAAIIKYGIGSTSVYYNWRADIGGAQFVTFTQGVIKQTLEHLVHAHRINPVFRGLNWMQGANDAGIGGESIGWTRSGTTITVTDPIHGRSTGQKIPIVVTSDAATIPLGEYTITVIDAGSYSFTANNAGATSGTFTYSAGSQYKPLFTAIIKGIVDYINNTVLNEANGGTGYSTSKLRVFIPRTRAGGATKATSLADTQAAQIDIGANFLTDNPTYASKVKGTSSQSTDDVALQDASHYTTAGYDTPLGTRIFDYFNLYINE